MIGKRQEIIKWLYNQNGNDYFEIKPYKEKRKLRANSYAWTLIGKIARVVGSKKEEVYREYIKDKGIYSVVTLSSEAVPTFIEKWERKGLGYICETSKGKTEDSTDVIAYYGTSSYNTKEMSDFIDYVVSEAKELEIETLPPHEIQRLKDLWE